MLSARRWNTTSHHGEGTPLSKLLYAHIDPYNNECYLEVDSIGQRRWSEMLLKEFPTIAFAEYMLGHAVPTDVLTAYNDKRQCAIERLERHGQYVGNRHIHMVFDLISRDRIKKFFNAKLSSVFTAGVTHDPDGVELSPLVKLAHAFAVSNMECVGCGGEDPAVLYYVPHNCFRKASITDYIRIPSRTFGALAAPGADTCAACKPRLYPAVTGHPWWSRYSTSDQSRCRCTACE